MQRAVASVFGPMEEGATRALKPARDMINWFSETFNARGTPAAPLITDGRSAVSARVLPSGPDGVAKPEVGNPSNLLLDFIDKSQTIHKGQILVTAGWSNGATSSAFPPGIPIGKVSDTT